LPWDTKQIADHQGWQWPGEVLNHVNATRLTCRIKQLVSKCLDCPAQPFHASCREGLAHQRPQTGVLGRIHVHHPAGLKLADLPHLGGDRSE